jgi:hypothetical protein
VPARTTPPGGFLFQASSGTLNDHLSVQQEPNMVTLGAPMPARRLLSMPVTRSPPINGPKLWVKAPATWPWSSPAHLAHKRYNQY